MFARRYGVTEVSLQGSVVRFSLLSVGVPGDAMHRLYPRSVWKARSHDLVPRPGAGAAAAGRAAVDGADRALRVLGAGGGTCSTVAVVHRST